MAEDVFARAGLAPAGTRQLCLARHIPGWKSAAARRQGGPRPSRRAPRPAVISCAIHRAIRNHRDPRLPPASAALAAAMKHRAEPTLA